MKTITLLFAVLSVLFVAVATADDGQSSADRIIQRYLDTPHPAKDRAGEMRGQRLHILRELKAMPDDAVPAIAAVLPAIEEFKQRKELIEILGRIPTRKSADLLISLMRDPSPKIRGQVVLGLRRLASRVRRAGVVRVPEEPQHPPKVEGLVPHLIAAANDEHQGVRAGAIFALADTRDPAAVAEIRRHLNDPSQTVRFKSACFLTEFGDDSGLPELRKALVRLKEMSDAGGKSFEFYWQAEHLFISFQRITGKDMGKIPMLPFLSSSMGGQERIKDDFDRMLDAWDEWWTEHDNTSESEG